MQRINQLTRNLDPSHSDQLILRGQIQFDTMMSLYKESLDLMAPMKKIIIDLKQLDYCDSSGLALFTAWLRFAKLQKKSIQFINVPSFLRNLIQVYGLDPILPIQMVV